MEWIAISFSRGSSRPRDRTRVSHIVDRRFTVWATREVKKTNKTYFFVLVQLLSRVQLSLTPWTAACHAPLSFTICAFSQIRVNYWVSDAMQPSHPLLPLLLLFSIFPSYRGLFPVISSSHHVAKVLELQLQHQSFQWLFRVDFLKGWLVWYPCSPRGSQESSPTP